VSQRLTAASADTPRVAVASAMERSRADIALVEDGVAVDLALAAIAAPIPDATVQVAAEAGPVAADVAVVRVDARDAVDPPLVVAQAPGGRPPRADKDDYDVEEYDPWEKFNEAMFDFNVKFLDRRLLKPVAKAYDKVVPDEVQRMIDNAFDNMQSIKRFVNSLLQAKWDGAVREFSRFLLNSTVGVGGLFDMAKAAQIEKSREDFGQTLCVYGAGPGPFLVLPFQPPYTVRDFIGRVVDSFFHPLTYVPMTWWQSIAIEAEERVNERSLNLELFQGFEETVIDMYSAVRHAYLERRRNMCKE
jgi:phospholipid-binding lipoprotein MlaA